METEDTIAVSWSIDDVKKERPDLNDNECRFVLEFIKRRHDASIGIHWDVVRTIAEELYPLY